MLGLKLDHVSKSGLSLTFRLPQWGGWMYYWIVIRLLIFLILVKQVKFTFSKHFLENAWEKWPEIWNVEVSLPHSKFIRLWSWSVDFPHFGAILTLWNRLNFGFLWIFFRIHGRNGIKFGMLMYPDQLWSWLHFGHSDIFVVSRQFLENPWEEWAKILYAGVSWQPSQLIRNVDLPHFCHDRSMVPCQTEWLSVAKGATAIRSPDLLAHLYLVISDEMKRQTLAYEDYQVNEWGISLTIM